MSSVPYRIESERLVVRCLELSDAEDLYRLVLDNQAYLAEWMPWARQPLSLDGYMDHARGRRAAFDEGKDFAYGVFDRETGAIVGCSGLHTRCMPGGLELGYWISEGRAGQGLATEAGAVMCRCAFEHFGKARVELLAHEQNHASRRVAEKLGFQLEGVLRNKIELGDTWVNAATYSLLPGEGTIARFAYRAFDGLGRELQPQPA